MPPQQRQHDLITNHSIRVLMTRPTDGNVDLTTLDPQQRAALDLTRNGTSFFLTGDPGTGKTFTVIKIIEYLLTKYSKHEVAVTASTGAAANKIQGQTIHSWAGLTGCETTTEQALKKVINNNSAVARWIEAKVLIVDESKSAPLAYFTHRHGNPVSLVTGFFISCLDMIGRKIRQKDIPFGNIQLITSGDFLQLPPVTPKNSSPDFAFMSTSWMDTFTQNIRLTTAYRQQSPRLPGFIKILQEIRIGKVSDLTANILRPLKRQIPRAYLPDVEVVLLFCTRSHANAANEERLSKIPGHSTRYTCIDDASTDHAKKLVNNGPAERLVKLKTGAQVILRKNIGNGLHNGSPGVVLGFYTSYDVQSEDDRSSSPQTLFSIRDVQVDENSRPLRAQPGSRRAVGGRKENLFPLVKFMQADTHEHVLVLDEEFTFDYEERGKTIRASRIQVVPLSLGWAMTVHRSQGSGFQKVSVDCSRTFSPGQLYVALSRAQSLQGLQVLGFEPKKVTANATALKFMKDTFGSL